MFNQQNNLLIFLYFCSENVSPNHKFVNPHQVIRPSPIDPMFQRRKLYRMAGNQYSRMYFDKAAKTVSMSYLMIPPRFTNSTIEKGPSKLVKINCPNCFQNSQQISHHHNQNFNSKPKKVFSYQYQGLKRQNTHDGNAGKVNFDLSRSPLFTPSPPQATIRIYHN